MKNNNNLEVALTKELCPVCLKEMDGPLVMNQILTEKKAQEIKELHNKVVGISEKPCEKCELYTKLGIVVIGIDPEKTEDMKNPYRTGNLAVIKKEFFDRNEINIGDNKIIFMDYKEMESMGMIP
jgi:hypothetical protein